MKIQYFKKLNALSQKPIIFNKLIDSKTLLSVESDQIDITEDIEENGFGSLEYHLREKYVDATKEEFDNFYKKTVKKINNLSSL